MERLELSSALAGSRQFIANLKNVSEVDIKDCYQCGKCSAGCPFVHAMDYHPHRILRMLQLGQTEQVLKSKSIWVCIHCSTCYARCPKEVDLPRLMEALRIEAKKRGLVGERTVDIFSDLFLGSVEMNGRVHEMGMMAFYNLKSGHLFQDAMTAPLLLAKGKISPLPHRIKGQAAIKRIFTKAKEMGDERL